MLSFEVIRGQWRSAWGHSFDLSLVWTYFHCNSAVFSFHLICNMPIFSWFSIFQFLRSENGGQKTLTYDGRSNQVIYTKKRCQIRKIWVKIGGVEHRGRPCKMKTVASTPRPKEAILEMECNQRVPRQTMFLSKFSFTFFVSYIISSSWSYGFLS